MFVNRSADKNPQTGRFDQKQGEKHQRKHPQDAKSEDALVVTISHDSTPTADDTLVTNKGADIQVVKTSVDVKA